MMTTATMTMNGPSPPDPASVQRIRHTALYSLTSVGECTPLPPPSLARALPDSIYFWVRAGSISRGRVEREKEGGARDCRGVILYLFTHHF